MIKYAILLLNMLAIILMRFFFADDVSVKMNTPAKVKQGEEFIVSIVIDKGTIAGVGHMKQELPAGLSNATVVESKGAEFKYLPEDNVVKFTWISLPADKEIAISYKVVVGAAASNGNINLGGKFSYVVNNEKQTYLIPQTTIMIGEEIVVATSNPETTTTSQPESTAVSTNQPETTTATLPAETTAVNTSQPETTPTTVQVDNTTITAAKTDTETNVAPSKTEVQILTSRTIVGSPEAGMEFTVEINVKKDGVKGFARIQETLPVGLTAVALDNKGGTFSFIDQKVKIIWDNLTDDEEIKVSYRVLTADNLSGDMTIKGAFSYVENDDPKSTEISATKISIKAKTSLASNTITDTPNTTSTTTIEESTSKESTTTTSVPTPEDKVNYKVQICALSKMQRGTSYFETKFTLGAKVNMEFHEGWKKYVVGKYDQYKEARDYRESIRSKGVENPFVTAYNSGKRITVQEALMVTNQQWVR